MEKKIAIVSGIAAVLSIVTIITVFLAKQSVSNIPIYGHVPSFQALSQDSTTVLSETLLKNKITILNFFFTHCPSICPMMTARIAEMNDYYKNEKEKVQFVSITVDPKNDIPSVLSSYKHKHIPNAEWTLLYEPDLSKIKLIAEKGFLVPMGELPGEHSGMFILIDKKGDIRGYYGHSDNASIRSLKSHIRELELSHSD